MMTVCDKGKETIVYLKENDCIKIIGNSHKGQALLIQYIKGKLVIKQEKAKGEQI